MPKKILYLGLDPSHYGKENVVHCPMIQISPKPFGEIKESLLKFNEYTHIIITSKTTISMLDLYFKEIGSTIQELKKKNVIAVGHVTAKYLNKAGIACRIPQSETAEGVVEVLEKLDLCNSYLFLPQSAQARPVIKSYLIHRNIRVEICEIYDTKTLIPKILPQLENFDEIVFTSPSTVKAFLEIFGTFPKNIQLTPIGPITAKFLPSN